MKKILLALGLVVLATGATMAQEQGQINAKAGLALGTKASVDDDGDAKMGLGINLGGEYFFTDAISIAPTYTLFFPTKIGETKIIPSVLNLDGRYYFNANGLSLYGTAGLAVQSVKVKWEGDSDTGNLTTFNLGAGILYPLADKISLDGQLKLMGGDEDETFDGAQFVLSAGISYRIK
ncbi:outer membrane beta-barrel protein [Pontibacter sp. KCTC 32443]|uniref:outer membrane beta-barrel protein n=1 Tax=Pontibacter TaxID=323449 RepID=UPI00164D1A5F|nr:MULTISPECIES: outer membrane beta-barrel protein [Pontibacter]MBC5772922.1 outer membrane beta-barrel protein [Pontibacter sp. KCTC 32443]